ncbi:hypothetical protein TSUD_423540, partial [Trifolium subterraneum]
WKQKICAEPDACVKDPAHNFWNFATSTLKKSNSFQNGRTLATACGFKRPQNVIFTYKSERNQFNMRFVDNNGDDILYLGTRHPIDYHRMRLQNPNLIVVPAYYHVITEHEGERCYVPTEWLEISAAFLKMEEDAKKADGDGKKADGDAKKAGGDGKKTDGDAKKAGGDGKKVDGDGKKTDGDGAVNSHQPNVNDGHYKWEQIVGQRFATGQCVLVS